MVRSQAVIMNAMTIGRLAKAADVHIETIRYYQRRGLLPEPERPQGGVRRYGEAEISRLRFIRRAQAAGFRLDEIASLLQIEGRSACERTRLLTEQKLSEVRQRIGELRLLEAGLKQLVEECRASAGDACPTLDRLAKTIL